MKSYVVLFLLLVVSYSFSMGQGSAAFKENDTTGYNLPASDRFKGKDLFDTDELLDIKLVFDIRGFLKSKDQKQYQDAVLYVATHNGDSLSQKVQLRARGKMRCNYCSFPPVMLKFKSNGAAQEIIKHKGNLKLVTHCNRSPRNENYVLKEYLAYRLMNLVTPFSFRTRLVRILYVDSRGSKKNFYAYGFLIEDIDQLAERNNAVVIENQNLAQSHMNSDDMARTAIFNYMIGNTDWSVASLHNVKVLTSIDKAPGQGIPVTYDFDYSGFVNTSYAAPSGKLPIKSVTERYYQGMCMDDEAISPVIEQFRELRGQFINTVNEFEYLSPGSKKQLVAYLNSFYKAFRSPDVLISDLNRTCKVY